MMYINTLGKTPGQQRLYEDKERILNFFSLNGYEVVFITNRNSEISYDVLDGEKIRTFVDYADAGYPLMFRLELFAKRA